MLPTPPLVCATLPLTKTGCSDDVDNDCDEETDCADTDCADEADRWKHDDEEDDDGDSFRV